MLLPSIGPHLLRLTHELGQWKEAEGMMQDLNCGL